ncbi:MAG: hypothetical protein AAF975_03755, partial [Spirochaetota bacterium]
MSSCDDVRSLPSASYEEETGWSFHKPAPPQWGVTAQNFADNLEFVGPAVQEEGYHVWGSSPIVGPDGKVHLFVSRWPVEKTFSPGWHQFSEIAHYVGESPVGPFQYKRTVLQGTGVDSDWDEKAPHNPSVYKVGGQYVLLYIANSGSTTNQSIGMLTAPTLDGPWQKIKLYPDKPGLLVDHSKVPKVWNHRSRKQITNPALIRRSDGSLLVYYAAYYADGASYLTGGYGVAVSRNGGVSGPYTHHPRRMDIRGDAFPEDGNAFRMNNQYYFLFMGHYAHKGFLLESTDGIDFAEKYYT